MSAANHSLNEIAAPEVDSTVSQSIFRDEHSFDRCFAVRGMAFFGATLVCDEGQRSNWSGGQIYERRNLRHYGRIYVNGSVDRPNGDNERVAGGAVVSLVC